MEYSKPPRAFPATIPPGREQPRQPHAQKMIFLQAFRNSGRREWYGGCGPLEGSVAVGPREWSGVGPRPDLKPCARSQELLRASSLGSPTRRPPLMEAGLGKPW